MLGGARRVGIERGGGEVDGGDSCGSYPHASCPQVPMAKASIFWLVGEYSSLIPKIGPDVLRKAAKSFVTEVCCVCVYVSIYVCMGVCVYVCMYMYVCVCLCVCV